MVDGFYGATELKKDSLEDYKFLTTFNLEAEYIEDGHHHTYSAPVIRVDNETQELTQIRLVALILNKKRLLLYLLRKV